jgi:hypothetical protein
MIYHSDGDVRWQRRIRFSLHITAYILFCIIQSVLLPYDLFALGLRSFLFMTIILHVSWLCSAARSVLSDLPQAVPQPILLLPESQTHIPARRLPEHDFWYRWHDI